MRALTLGESEWIAQRFHATYEALAPAHGYETRPDSAVDWKDVPPQNKGLMIDVAQHLFAIDENNKLVMTDEFMPSAMVGGGQFPEGKPNGYSND